MQRPATAASWASAALALALAASAAAEPPPDPQRLANAWRTLRIVDCARCHGRYYDGSSGPSITAYAGTQSRDLFVRAILDGNPGRGMPGYRSNTLVAAAIDDIYLYFKARADGAVAADYRPAPP